MSRGPRGKVLKMDTVGLGPSPFYRTRDTSVLLREEEWGWSTDPLEAWIFDTFDAHDDSATFENDAAAHIGALPKDEREHCHPIVVGINAQIEAERARRHRDRVASIEASAHAVAPEETYRETARRLGERE